VIAEVGLPDTFAVIDDNQNGLGPITATTNAAVCVLRLASAKAAPGVATHRQTGSVTALNMGCVSDRPFTICAEDEPSWAEIVRRAERGESVLVVAHGEHVADIVPSRELERLRETIRVLADTELARDLRDGLLEANRGETVDLGSFAQYAGDSDVDDTSGR
jgi:prevent-host-death family protein